MPSRLLIALFTSMLSLTALAASPVTKPKEAKPAAYDNARFRSCAAYAATAMSAAADMQANGYSAKRALVEGGNPPSASMVALTEFAASTMQARPVTGRDAAAVTSGFLAGICYQRADMPVLQ